MKKLQSCPPGTRFVEGISAVISSVVYVVLVADEMPRQLSKEKQGSRPVAAPRKLDTSVTSLIVVLAETVTRAFENLYQERFGLGVMEGRVVFILGARGEQTTQEVIQYTRMDRVRVSRAVIRLSDKGLVMRRAKPRDQRAQVLRLSPTGESVYRQLVPLALTLQEDFVESLAADERRQLESILSRLSTWQIPAHGRWVGTDGAPGRARRAGRRTR